MIVNNGLVRERFNYQTFTHDVMFGFRFYKLLKGYEVFLYTTTEIAAKLRTVQKSEHL